MIKKTINRLELAAKYAAPSSKVIPVCASSVLCQSGTGYNTPNNPGIDGDNDLGDLD